MNYSNKIKIASYGTQLIPADDGIYLISLEFSFTYLSTVYTQVSISTNGYVCLGNNPNCYLWDRPLSYDILVGLSFDLDSSRNGSGQIYYQLVASNSSFFTSATTDIRLLNPNFSPTQIFMITYDGVLPYNITINASASFQIWLATDNAKFYVEFKFTSCLSGQVMSRNSGLDYNNSGVLEEVVLTDPCNSSNVESTGKWVYEVTNLYTG